MKKTIIMLFALAGVATATDNITLSSTTQTGNYNAAIYGFYLNLSSDELSINPNNSTLTDSIVIESITLMGKTGDVNNSFIYDFGLIILEETSNNILGYSTNNLQSEIDVNPTFTFTSVYGKDLILNSSSTYRFLAVGPGALGLFDQDKTKSYIYSASSNNASSSTEGNVVTITGGIKNPGFRLLHDENGSADDCCVIDNVNGITASNILSPIIVNMSIRNIPEPATATLSLLALAGLAGRRRRR